MKSFFAIPLFAAAAMAVAEPAWDFTFTYSDGHSTWTSVTEATANPTIPVAPASTSAWTGLENWTSYTSYTATYSSGSSTWGIPTTVSYSIASGWTSMIPAPATTAPATTAKPATSSTVSKPPASTFTGAANVNGKMAGVGAVAMAGLALVL
ncbi:hypothetical protein LTR84_006489 [Exophiala bonariae]|uniref:WW domain-containing protein n=1 Tax=Exophiala bonariae TaxID=1690606 RepID=A0AAV9N452_9EURO|nr:hypothetical protein LTR84_006489 [Exophiala bonariae]